MRSIFLLLVVLPMIAAAGGGGSYSSAGAYSLAASASAARATNAVTVNNQTSTEIDYSKLAPPVAPAPLVSSYSPDVCLGSVTGGVSGGGFGISAGTTTLDHDCVQRRDIRLLHNLGHPDAALAMACQDAEMGEALRSVGKCPPVAPKQKFTTYSFEELD